jgi:hypothetical protein
MLVVVCSPRPTRAQSRVLEAAVAAKAEYLLLHPEMSE